MFGRWIGYYEFDDVCSETDIKFKVSKLNSLLQQNFRACFLAKVVTVKDTDKPQATSRA